MSTPVRLDIHDGVATLTLADASGMNLLSPPLLRGCLDALARLRDDATVRVLVLAAEGRAFSAGADLGALAASPDPAADVAALMDDFGNPLVAALHDLPVPVLCSLGGVAAGGGVGIVLAADIVVAARSAGFVLPFVPRLGLIPDMGAVWFLQRAVGRSRSLALTLLGDRLGAEQAAAWGLVWDCVDDDQLPAATAALARRLAALPPHVVRDARALHAAAESNLLADQLRYEAARQRELIAGPAFAAGASTHAGRRP